jgi:conjugal transfer pilus assembly protein TraV
MQKQMKPSISDIPSRGQVIRDHGTGLTGQTSFPDVAHSPEGLLARTNNPINRLLCPLLAGVCLLSGCAGVKSEFECNVTSSDSCMTMQQANEKAKAAETPGRGKPDATALPRLAEGDFHSTAVASPPGIAVPPLASLSTGHAVPRSVMPGNYPRPLRVGEQVASLWIAPYIDTGDVYHQPAVVLFVVKPSRWGHPGSDPLEEYSDGR